MPDAGLTLFCPSLMNLTGFHAAGVRLKETGSRKLITPVYRVSSDSKGNVRLQAGAEISTFSRKKQALHAADLVLRLLYRNTPIISSENCCPSEEEPTIGSNSPCSSPFRDGTLAALMFIMASVNVPLAIHNPTLFRYDYVIRRPRSLRDRVLTPAHAA
ncbi:hypothetical protein WG66_003903 [Moniliophthora roreri]|nr:hypothetical protein WG66_003903 [Moniliophthora roreri]